MLCKIHLKLQMLNGEPCNWCLAVDSTPFFQLCKEIRIRCLPVCWTGTNVPCSCPLSVVLAGLYFALVHSSGVT